MRIADFLDRIDAGDLPELPNAVEENLIFTTEA